MADNKYNQSLLDMGYSQEQIDSMVNAVRSWQDANAVVRWTNQPPRSWDVDLSTYDGTDGKGNVTTWPWNANLNYNQYWDDSNPNQQSQRGWLNSKYTGEWTSNTYIEYNPNLRTSDLDPNYLYGQAAKDRNRQDAGYIARRNDNIASALYNEWRVSKEDVAQFLASQNEWMNSTEADRLNTIESVWKRLGQIKPQEEEPEEKPDLSVADQIATDTSGKLYGKVTADEWGSTTGIDTLADANSVYKTMEEWRISNLKALATMKIDDIATSMYSGINPYWEQAWRDYQQYYPEFAAKVQEKIKKLKAQDNVNAISSGKGVSTTADTANTNTETTSYAVNNATNSVSATQLLKSIDSILESNDSAKSAQELMWSIEKDMATLKNRLMNLKNEARSAFKWDVPQYIVTAYMNNKAQEIQNQLSILEDRYNAAYDRYKTEMSNAQWQAEFDLKKESLELEWWKAKNTTTSTTSGTNSSYMRTERNNNPTAMTTDYAKMMWLELWVDYEIWDSFVWLDWRTYYTAKFLWDPIETAIKAFDRWAANNVFGNEGWVLGHWHLWISNSDWLKMTTEQKRDVIYKILQKEWGSMSNMAYYLNNSSTGSSWAYDVTYKDAYNKYLSWNYTPSWLKAQATSMWTDEQWFAAQAKAYAADLASWKIDAESAASQSKYWLNVLSMIAQLYNMASNDKWKLDFNIRPWTTAKDKFNQINSELTLEKMVEARKSEIWFWQVTEWERAMLKNAASALTSAVWRADSSINNEMERVIQVLWKATYWTNISQADWQNFLNRQKAIDDWNKSADLDVFDTSGWSTSGGSSWWWNQQYTTNDILSL